MGKFIQICASHNDLFALDEQGDVHQYNFDTKMWTKLVANHQSDKEKWGAG